MNKNIWDIIEDVEQDLEGVIGEEMDNPFTIVYDAVIMNSIDFTVHDKMLYTIMRTYLSKGNYSVFPAQKTLARMVGCARKTIIASLKTLEKKGIIKITERKGINGRKTSLVYTFLKIPEAVKQNALICQKEKTMYEEIMTNRKQEKAEIKKEKEKSSTSSPQETEQKELKLCVKEISINAGKGYKLFDKHLNLLEKENALQHLVDVKEERVNVSTKTTQSYFKLYIGFVKVFNKIPTENELNRMIELSLQEFSSNKVVFQALKVAKKEKIEVCSEDFYRLVASEKDKDFDNRKKFMGFEENKKEEKKQDNSFLSFEYNPEDDIFEKE